MNDACNPLIFFDEFSESKTIEITIPGKPFAKQRPRASRRGRFMTMYTPQETINYENLVKYSYYEQNGSEKLEGPLSCELIGIYPIPNSISKKKKSMMLSNTIKHTKKPDCDNMAKICLDALNGIAYDDDSQICSLNVSKRYGISPCVKILLKELEGE